jgi:hypothetical protein
MMMIVGRRITLTAHGAKQSDRCSGHFRDMFCIFDINFVLACQLP